MTIAIALGCIGAAVIIALAIGAFCVWAITTNWFRGFTDADLSVAWRAFLDDAQTGGFLPLELTPGQVKAYVWLQGHE